MTIGLKENGEPLSVFIIDDSEAMVKIIARTLDSFGVKHIGSANDGNSAIEQLRILPEPVDLICLDITMPIKDGL
ncbi:MAG: response regulator, partial [Candidatus Margulisiibacteriota bacterium]